MDANKSHLLPLFAVSGVADAKKWWSRWRIFFMACAELGRAAVLRPYR